MPWNNDDGNSKGPQKGPWGTPPKNSGGGNKGGGTPPDLEDFFKLAQDKLKASLGNGGGGFGVGGGSSGSAGQNPIKMASLILIGAAVLWGLSGFYRVEPDEAGVEMVFGKVQRIRPPGLNYLIPAPFGHVLTPKVTTVNRTDIGGGQSNEYRSQDFRGTRQSAAEESQMLTGDENIVDVDFAVFWVVKTTENGVADYLFNIQNPEGTVKAVAESAMREVIGRNKISGILTEGRQKIEAEVQDLIQKTLDSYKAGISITQVQMQKVDPPAAVIDSFRDVQAARADQERLRNEATTYRNKLVPEARGEAEKIRQGADAYRQKVVNDAKGQADRFTQVLDEYKKAPAITKERLYIETMEKVMSNSDKVLIDNNAGVGDVMPYLPLEAQPRRATINPQQQNRNAGAQ